jgi:hypothetical protein
MPAGNTYEAIATQTLSTTSSGITFSSIPNTYTDLVLVATALFSTQQSYRVRFNSDTGNNYSLNMAEGNGSSTYTAFYANYPYIFTMNTLTGDTTAPAPNIFNIMNYSNTTTNKTVVVRENASGGTYPGAGAVVGMWRSTAAINTILIYPGGGTFNSGSTFTLYGIKAA